MNKPDTAIIRRLDESGRPTLPEELRKRMGLLERGAVTIAYRQKTDAIIIQKWAETCLFCGAREGLSVFFNRSICARCLEEFRRL